MTSLPRVSQLIRRTASRLDADVRADEDGSAIDPKLARLAAGRKGDALSATEREIAGEIAYSLGKAGRRLERAIVEAQRAAELLKGVGTSDPAHGARLQAFRDKRREAERRLRYLKIQREALGFRSHRDLDRRYRVPDVPLAGINASSSSSSS